MVLMVGSGDQLESLKVHKNRLCEKAPVFNKMFNDPFIEVPHRLRRFPRTNLSHSSCLSTGYIKPLFDLLAVNINTS